MYAGLLPTVVQHQNFKGLTFLSRISLGLTNRPPILIRKRGKNELLTDRQKWAFGWMSPGDVVADIGSSNSPLLAVLSKKSRNVIAVDIDRTSLTGISREMPEIQVIESSSSNLPIHPNSCDTVLFLDVLEHVDDERKSIEEIWRILKTDGELILSVPNKGMFRFLDPQNLSARVKGTYVREKEHRHYSEKDLLGLLGSKFRIVRRHYGGLFVYPATFALDNLCRKYFRMNWGRLFKKLGDWDNDISWGSFSYNLIILARKV